MTGEMGGAEALLQLGRGQSALGVGAHDAGLLLPLGPVIGQLLE